MKPTYPRIISDRDKYRDWYLDEDVTIPLLDGSTLNISKGYRFDGHSTKIVLGIFFVCLFILVTTLLAPKLMLAILLAITSISAVASFFVLWLFKPYNEQDIYCALVHDALIDFESMHRYNRAYIDTVYKVYMNSPHYKSTKLRAFFMPLAVSVYGYLRFTMWGDYRGEPKENQTIVVSVV